MHYYTLKQTTLNPEIIHMFEGCMYTSKYSTTHPHGNIFFHRDGTLTRVFWQIDQLIYQSIMHLDYKSSNVTFPKRKYWLLL